VHGQQAARGAVNDRLGLAVEFIEPAHDAAGTRVHRDPGEIPAAGRFAFAGDGDVTGVAEDGKADLVGELFAVTNGRERRGGGEQGQSEKEETGKFHSDADTTNGRRCAGRRVFGAATAEPILRG
jgi:hypothetical protein